jgi:hypothetical protein
MSRRLRVGVLGTALWASAAAAALAGGCGDRPLGGQHVTTPAGDGSPPPADGGAAEAPDTRVSDPTADCAGLASPFVACGCGCCGAQPQPTLEAGCYYPALGESPATIDPPRTPESCANAGCSIGQRYLCCASPAAPIAETPSYCAYDLATDIERYEILKTDGTICTRIRLEGLPSGHKFPVSTPAGFEVSGGHRVPCLSSAAGVQAIGAIGSVGFRPAAQRPTLDVHVTLFFADGPGGTVDAERFDVDGVALDASTCGF